MSADHLYPWDEDETREASRRERQVQRRMRICVHNRGTIDYTVCGPEYDRNHVCGAGVDWRTVRVQHEPALAMWPPEPATTYDRMTQPAPFMLVQSVPCSDMLNTGCASCAHRQTMTREQAAEHVAAEHRAVLAVNRERRT